MADGVGTLRCTQQTTIFLKLVIMIVESTDAVTYNCSASLKLMPVMAALCVWPWLKISMQFFVAFAITSAAVRCGGAGAVCVPALPSPSSVNVETLFIDSGGGAGMFTSVAYLYR